MEAIILAGGLGTRLREVVRGVAKPMAPVNGRPFLEYVLNWLRQYQVEKVVLSTGYMSGSVSGYFEDSFFGIPIEYIIEKKPLGTGGAVRYALQKTSGSTVLIINGDTYFPIDLERFISFHSLNNNLFTLALKRMQDFSRYGSVECSGDIILKFNEKKFCNDGLINGGIYLADRKFFESRQLPEIFSLEKDLLEKEAGSAMIKCQIFDDVFIDIGIPEDYRRAQALLKVV